MLNLHKVLFTATDLLSESKVSAKCINSATVRLFLTHSDYQIVVLPSGCCRSLQCDRLRVHRHFMSSLVIFYLVSIVYYEPYIHASTEPLQPWYKTQVGTRTTCKASSNIGCYKIGENPDPYPT